jgi:hypothetical protein
MKARYDSLSKRTSITLADGTFIGAQQQNITYQDIAGPIYRMVKAVVSTRFNRIEILYHINSC